MTEFADLEMSEVQKTWSFIMVHKLSYNISVTDRLWSIENAES